MAEEERGFDRTSSPDGGNPESDDRKGDMQKIKRKKRLMEEAEKADKRGICYLSRIPPRMDPLILRQILSQYGEIQRIYLRPEGEAARIHRKKNGGFRGQGFSEGWVEFTKKGVAKRVAKILNGQEIGGKKRSMFYYDLWNIKYLSKFKWDDLTEEIAYKNAIREQKLALEISAAKRESSFYLSKVDQSRALSSIEERIKKKGKVHHKPEASSDVPEPQFIPKTVRQYPQKRSFAANDKENKPRLSKDFLAGVFG